MRRRPSWNGNNSPELHRQNRFENEKGAPLPARPFWTDGRMAVRVLDYRFMVPEAP
jgi:hypothetical protein